MVIFNLRRKKNILFSHSHNHMSLQSLHTMFIFLLTVQTAFAYIPEQPGIVSTAANESILAPLSKQTESSYSSRDFEALELLPMPVAWLGYVQLGMPRSCC
jgi:hypothetical protein